METPHLVCVSICFPSHPDIVRFTYCAVSLKNNILLEIMLLMITFTGAPLSIQIKASLETAALGTGVK